MVSYGGTFPCWRNDNAFSMWKIIEFGVPQALFFRRLIFDFLTTKNSQPCNHVTI